VRLDNPAAARVLLEGCVATAAKFRKYLLVRTQMSAVTGLLVGAFAWMAGLPFAFEWGRDRLRAQLYPVHRSFVARCFRPCWR
jgi:AI-2 transport protein TqsA